jgi:hypothetical protein
VASSKAPTNQSKIRFMPTKVIREEGS